MKTLAKQPGEALNNSCLNYSALPYGSIRSRGVSRAETKAIYRMLGNERFDNAEMPREHQAATIRRIAGESVVLAVTPDGLAHGILDQTHYNRPRTKDDAVTRDEKKIRPVEKPATMLPRKVIDGWK
jgi:hypothetical protein